MADKQIKTRAEIVGLKSWDTSNDKFWLQQMKMCPYCNGKNSIHCTKCGNSSTPGWVAEDDG